jgi:putative membrane protein insertion efficiency factor
MTASVRTLAVVPKFLLLKTLRLYKIAVSPLLPPSCRYVPTCSEYAAEAIERHGALRGSVLAMARLLRCLPFVRGGFDPVPLNESCRSSAHHCGMALPGAVQDPACANH